MKLTYTLFKLLAILERILAQSLSVFNHLL